MDGKQKEIEIRVFKGKPLEKGWGMGRKERRKGRRRGKGKGREEGVSLCISN